MAKHSAGLLMYRKRETQIEVFLVHPGGPFWARKDRGAWMLPKGEIGEGEEHPLLVAQREFREETGFLPQEPFLDLGSMKQAGGKLVSAWAFEGDCDSSMLKSNLCTIEWPPRTGRKMEIPEVDRGQWFSIQDAREYMLPSQTSFLDRLLEALSKNPL